MNKNIRNVSALGLFALSATAIMVGCNKNNNLNKPHITLFGCNFLDVTYDQDNLQFGKDATITIKPKEGKYVHLRKFNKETETFAGEAFKPYVGYGNAIYQSKAPLTEGFHFDYLPLSEKEGKEGFETFKLTIKGEYFTNPIIISYRDEERMYTPQGMEEIARGGNIDDISSLYEESPYSKFEFGDTENYCFAMSENNLEPYWGVNGWYILGDDSETYICNGYQKFVLNYTNPNVTLTDDTTCTIYGIKADKKDANEDPEPVKIETTTTIGEDNDIGQTICVKVNNDKLIKNGNENIYKKLIFEVNLSSVDNLTLPIKGNCDKDFAKDYTPIVYKSYGETPVFEDDEETEISLYKEFAELNHIAAFAWVEPTENSTFKVEGGSGNGPQVYTNFDFASNIDEILEDLFGTRDIYQKVYKTIAAIPAETQKGLNQYFKGYITYTLTGMSAPLMIVYVPYDYTSESIKENNKLLVVYPGIVESQQGQMAEIIQKLKEQGIKTLTHKFERANDKNPDTPTVMYIGIGNTSDTKDIKGYFTNTGLTQSEESVVANAIIENEFEKQEIKLIPSDKSTNDKEYICIEFNLNLINNDYTDKKTVTVSKTIEKPTTETSLKFIDSEGNNGIIDEYISEHKEELGEYLTPTTIVSDVMIRKGKAPEAK